MVLLERKPNKLCVDKGRYFTLALCENENDNDDILIYSTHNEGKSVVTGSFYELYKIKSSTAAIISHHHFICKKPIDDHCSAFTD